MADTDPLVIAIAGPNGAGKSTLAPFLLRNHIGLTEYVNADTIALGLSAFEPEGAAFEAARGMLGRLRALADAGSHFAFETTLATRSYGRWVRELKRRGYRFHVMFLWLRSPELALERVRNRVLAGGTTFPKRSSAGAISGACVTSSIRTSLWPTRGWCMIIPSPGA